MATEWCWWYVLPYYTKDADEDRRLFETHCNTLIFTLYLPPGHEKNNLGVMLQRRGT